MSYHAVQRLGATCGECQIVVGNECLPCPEGSDFPECDGCVDGARAQQKWHEGFWGIVTMGIVSSLVVTVGSAYLLHKARVKN